MNRRHFPAVTLDDLAAVLRRRPADLRCFLGHVAFIVSPRNTDEPDVLAVPLDDAAACLGYDPADLAERLGVRVIHQ